MQLLIRDPQQWLCDLGNIQWINGINKFTWIWVVSCYAPKAEKRTFYVKMTTKIDSYMDERKRDWPKQLLHYGSGCHVPGVVFDRWGNQALTVPDVFVQGLSALVIAAQKTQPNASSISHALVATGNWHSGMWSAR